MSYILTLIVVFTGAYGPNTTSLSQEHYSLQKCQTAMDSIRENLTRGSVVLLVCNPK